MKGKETLKKFIFETLTKRIDRFGYPIVKLTAPKNGVNFKVDRNDPNFDKPVNEVLPALPKRITLNN